MLVVTDLLLVFVVLFVVDVVVLAVGVDVSGGDAGCGRFVACGSICCRCSYCFAIAPMFV